jgi:alpha-N-arabinofuranosidase
MIVTPANYVYDMLVPHRDATLLPEELKCEDYALNGQPIPGWSAVSSVDSEDALHIPRCNPNPTNSANLTVAFPGATVIALN